SGSFKSVYRATWNRSNGDTSSVAVLQIKGSGSYLRDAFQQELNVTCELGLHPNLLRLLAITKEPASGDYCLVTEFACHGSLKSMLLKLWESRNTISALHKILIARQICDGMVQLALHNVVHRDLAARNVLVFCMDSMNHLDVQVKIADYGLSILSNCGYCNTNGGSMAGSTARPIRWMAPESIQRRLYSEQSDVWAFGVTMWEIWSYAMMPYGSVTDDCTVGSKIVDGERLANPDNCPAGIYAIMQKCWQDTRKDRPTFKELQ
ncbi:hypothetical protein GUITHDRAFT_48392, partial [Guillardia theta CCMP2712]